MLHELQPEQFERVRPLFGPLADLVFCGAVLAGTHPGRVYVDNPDTPGAALLVAREVWGYLAGNAADEAFHERLNKALFEREVVSEAVPLFQLTCHPEAWQAALPAICHPAKPIPETRHRFSCSRFTNRWGVVPDGFTVRAIDESLLALGEDAIPHDVRSVIDNQRKGPGALEAGFGFVILHGEQIVSHAVIDAFADGSGEIGLETAEEFRRQGLATSVCAAAIDYGLTHGLVRVTWDCTEANTGSVKTAHRLGLTHDYDYTMHYFFFEAR